MRLLLVLLIVCGGCSAGQGRYVDRSALALSTAALLVDAAQTRSAAAAGWQGFAEDNAIMGATPSTRTVELYFGTAILINAALWVALPSRWRSVIPGLVIGAQAPTITGNLQTTCVAGFGRC